MMRFNVLLFVCALVAVSEGMISSLKNLPQDELQYHTWAVLAAGSTGWSNYRHQADVCHAYHAIHDMGVPEDHIIVMMADDIAYNEKNPLPGRILNSEYTPSIDVYNGVPHDYTGSLVTSTVFSQILLGQDMKVGSRKSLKSGPDDNVFIFYDDHGNYDKLCFPDKNLRAYDVEHILSEMKERKLFKNLVFYVEACYSGSIFYDIEIPDNVYIATAAPIRTSSWAGCYNYLVGTSTCDLFASSWINDLEKDHKANYSFSDQFALMQNAMRTRSQGCEYGSQKVFNMPIMDFFGPSFGSKKDAPISAPSSEFIPTLDVELQVAKRAVLHNPSEENKRNLNREYAIRAAIDSIDAAIVSAATPDAPHLTMTPCSTCDESCLCFAQCTLGKERCTFECCNEESCTIDPLSNGPENARQHSCIKTLSDAFSDLCGNGHPYLLKTTQSFIRVCNHKDVNIDNALKEMRRQCAHFNVTAF